MTTTYTYRPDYATPPGWTLEETLEDLAMSQVELARRTGLSKKHVNQVIQGHAPITTDTAMRLERATGVPARLWNNLESRYQEHQARLEEEASLEEQTGLLDELPIRDMVSKGLLTKRASKPDRLREVFRFFAVADRDAWRETWTQQSALFRKSSAYESTNGALAVWLRLGQIQAARQTPDPWSSTRFRDVLERARELTREPDPAVWQPVLTDACASAGVAFVVTPAVSGARTHGAARWLGPDRALIQLSPRYRWSDIFWFSFFHEAKHILDQSKRSIYLERGVSSDEQSEEERAADSFAADFLIPPSETERLRSLRSKKDVMAFAATLGIHPGIVVGRLHHEGLWPRSDGNDLRQRLAFADHLTTV